MAQPPAQFLDEQRLLGMLSPASALEAVEAFFSRHARDQVQVPPRIHLPVPGRSTIGLYMPAATGDYIGVKIVHLMPDRRPSVEAEVFLYDAATGKLLFWGDGKPLTALRTAAVSLAATRKLLPQCRRLVVFGGGVQAAAHLAAFASAYPGLEEMRAVTRTPDGFARLRAMLSTALAERVVRSEDSAADIGRSDCIVMTTPSPEPLFRWADVPPTCHLVGIGSATHQMNEIPPEAFLESDVWVDTPVALEEAGDFHAAVKQGWKADALRGELFDLLADGIEHSAPPPRASGSGGRTLFKSVGQAAQDLAIFIRIWEELRRRGR